MCVGNVDDVMTYLLLFPCLPFSLSMYVCMYRYDVVAAAELLAQEDDAATTTSSPQASSSSSPPSSEQQKGEEVDVPAEMEAGVKTLIEKGLTKADALELLNMAKGDLKTALEM